MTFNPRHALRELPRETSKEVSPIFSTLGIFFVCVAVAGVAGYCLAIYG